MRFFCLFFLGIFCSLFSVDNRGYVTSSNNEVTVFDTTDDTVVTTISGFMNPMGLSVTPDGSKVYVANFAFDNILIIDANTNMFDPDSPITPNDPFSSPSDVCVLPVGNRAYSINQGTSTISVIDTISDTITTEIDGMMEGFAQLSRCVASNDGSRLYVLGTDAMMIPSLIEIDTSGSGDTVLNIINITGAVTPADLDILSDDSVVYITDSNDNNVKAVTIGPNTTTQIDVGGFSSGISISNDDATAYVNLQTGDAVARIRISDNMVLSSIPTTSGNLRGSEALPAGGFIYIANSAGIVEVININTNMIVTTIPIAGAQQIAFGPGASTNITSVGVIGQARANQAFTQFESFNKISWSIPSNITPIAYRIYRDSLFQNLAGEVSADQLEFEDHNRSRRTRYDYFVVAVESGGTETLIGQVSIISK